MKLITKPVCKKDYKFLYELLRQRNPTECVSHKEMPTYEQHVNFCDNNPYKEWQVVYLGKQPIGSIYLTKLGEVGIHFVKEYVEYGMERILDIFLPKIAYANVSPENKKFISILKKKGFRLIQHTYEKNIRP
jgi:hypothetical protein